MLVYGDAQVPADLAGAWAALGRLVSRLPRPPTLDSLRVLVVAAGQVEQAAHDALAPTDRSDAHPAVAAAHAVTATLARWLVARLERGAWAPGPDELSRLEALLSTDVPSLPVRLKIPEGFAFYGLRPEAYAAAAWTWLAGRGASSSAVLVLGVRSIGTTLAAVVAEALRARGLEVESHTVRPGGHPFERQASLAGWRLAPGRPVLAVDEGPGLSGSSLAAVARAAHAAGLGAAGVTLVPSHAGEPGPMAPAWVRGIWRDTPIVVPPAADVAGELASTLGGPERPAGESRPGARRSLGRASVGTGDESGAARHDAVDGGSRLLATASPPWDRPSPCRRFARPWLWLESDGERLRAKLGGLASVVRDGDLVPMVDVLAAGLADRARRGLGPAVRGTAAGYVVTEGGVTGALLGRDGDPVRSPVRPRFPDPCPPAAPALAAYLHATAGPPLSPEAWDDAVERASSILERNAAAVLSPEGLQALVDRRPRRPVRPALAATDYDLAGYHWLRAPSGACWKVGGRGAALWDHTAVGIQPLAWSIASAAVESGAPELARHLVGRDAADLRLPGSTGVEDPSWWTACYAAFRLGLATSCRDGCGGDEAGRAAADVERYAGVLRAAAADGSRRPGGR